MAKTTTKKQEVKKEVKNTQAKNTHTQAKKQSKSTIDKKLVVKMFKAGKTPYQIAKAIGKYYSQVAPILEREGYTWEKRPEGPTDKKTHSVYCTDAQFEQIKKLLNK